MSVARTPGLVLLCVLLFGSAFAGDPKPVLSKTPLSADSMLIYKAELRRYLGGDGDSKHPLNVSQSTGTFDVTLAANEPSAGCVSGLELEGSDAARTEFHQFAADAFTDFPGVRLVDPEKQAKIIKRNDPERTIQAGSPVHDAVAGAFQTGMLTFSEIVFDKSHTHAVLRYTFWCGKLCGHGGSLVYKKDKEWTLDHLCGNWIS